MNINLVNSNINSYQILHVQKRNQRFVLVPIQVTTTPGTQTATVAHLASVIDSGMFALYQKNRLYFNNKVLQEVAGLSSESSKIANLRASIIPSSDTNDEINSAEFHEMDGEQFINLKLSVARLSEEAGFNAKENSSSEDADISASFSAKVSLNKAKANNVHAENEITTTSSNLKIKRYSQKLKHRKMNKFCRKSETNFLKKKRKSAELQQFRKK